MDITPELKERLNKHSRKEVLRTFYIAAHGSEKKKCCISLTPEFWETFNHNYEKYQEEYGPASFSHFLRLMLQRHLINEGVTDFKKGMWEAFSKYCKENNKTLVSTLRGIIANSRNSVQTIFDVQMEALHNEIWGKTMSAEFNSRVTKAIENLNEKDREIVEKSVLISAVKITQDAKQIISKISI